MAFSSSSSNNKRQNFSEINITPLTDVFLVLLVIMIIIAPLLDQKDALKITPPNARSAKASQQQEQVKPILIEVSEEGVIVVNGQQIVSAEDPDEQISQILYEKISQISPKNPQQQGADQQNTTQPKLKLKADKESKHGRVIAVYDAANIARQNNQISSLVVLTEKPRTSK